MQHKTDKMYIFYQLDLAFKPASNLGFFTSLKDMPILEQLSVSAYNWWKLDNHLFKSFEK